MESMIKERSLHSFDVKELTYILDGGKDYTHFKEIARKIIERDAKLIKKRPYNLTNEEDREATMVQIRRFVEICRNTNNEKIIDALKKEMSCYDCAFFMRMYVHLSLFKETVWYQGTTEQYEHWKDQIENMEIIGCFSMTELGHSSYLRGIETIATYEKESEEFVINSSSLLATKWWIGMAGQTATHTVALCNLVIDSKNVGLHWFIVPLRDPSTGELKPGISAGHLGPKFGRQGLDNGWIQFTEVRIPRKNMLMKWGAVTPNGEYKGSKFSSLAYSTLIGERLASLGEIYNLVARALTITSRYSLVRTQGPSNKQLIDFQNHQFQLIPILSFCYATRFSSLNLDAAWRETLKSNESSPSNDFYLISQDYHCLSAGLKTWIGWWGADSLETIRRSLGGHAYSAYSGLPSIIGDYGVLTTGGGDNYVLGQQSTRYLIKVYQDVLNNKPIGNFVSYFTNYKPLLSYNIDGQKNNLLLCPDTIIRMFESLSVKLINRLSQDINDDLKSGKSLSNILNDKMVEVIECSRPHSIVCVMKIFWNVIESCAEKKEIQNILTQLFLVFGLYNIEKQHTQFLEFSILQTNSISFVRSRLLSLCKEIRKSLIHLVDAFDFTDWIVKSPLGKYDGNIYQSYFNDVLEGGSVGKAPYWDQEVLPIITSKL